MFSISQSNPVLYLGAVGCDPLDQGSKGRIKENRFVLSMVDDVDQLLRVKARVAGMQNHPASRDRIVGFEVPVVVPGNGAEGVARS